MKGYIAVVHRTPDSSYEVSFPDLHIDNGSEQSVDDAMRWAQSALDEFARTRAGRLPTPRPAHHMVAEAARCGAVAGVCLLPRPAAIGAHLPDKH